jgi:hypothetical protein
MVMYFEKIIGKIFIFKKQVWKKEVSCLLIVFEEDFITRCDKIVNELKMDFYEDQ